MNEEDFRELLKKLDDLLLVRKMGSAERTWLALGKLLEGKTLNDIRLRLTHLDIDGEVKQENGFVWLKITGKPLKKDRSVTFLTIPKVNIILLFLTIVTTLIAGSMLQGGNPLSSFGDIWKGLPYSVTLLLILGSHEFGHYYFARKNNVEATLPYFIPAPPFFIIGTFGALIKLKSPIYSRRVLLEIGAAGPITGFIVSCMAIVIGYSLIPDQRAVFDHIRWVHDLMGIGSEGSGAVLQLSMGTSVLFTVMGSLFNIVIPMDEIYHFPLIFAGWIGFLVTMLNLLPIGQLDGGHIAYAILGKTHNRMAKWIFLMLIPLGFISTHWWFWAVIILVFMRTWKHPPIFDIGSPISKQEKLIGLVCLMILLSCFIPVPIRVL